MLCDIHFTPLHYLMMISVCRFVHVNLNGNIPFHLVAMECIWSFGGLPIYLNELTVFMKELTVLWLVL